MAGLHIVRKPLKMGDRYYVYAWRGGPCIHTEDDRAPVITPEILALQQEMKGKRYGESRNGFERVLTAFRDSPEYAMLAPRTKVDYKLWLTRISERFGNCPIGVFNDRLMRGDIIEWRNTWASQPRTADKAVTILGTVLSWALDHAMIEINVAAGIRQLNNTAGRADLIWEDKHWAAYQGTKPPEHLMTALRMASWTGLRLGDLVTVTWDCVRTNAIILITRKRQGRAVIPILAPMRAWIEATPQAERTGTLLKNSKGKSWTESGLGSVFQKYKPEGFERRIHDIRGTFCTMLILKGLTDSETAMIMGWTSTRVAEIRALYVDEERVILSLSERLSA